MSAAPPDSVPPTVPASVPHTPAGSRPHTPAPPETVRRWHEVVDCPDPVRRSALLADLLGDDPVFHSPAVHSAQPGRALTTRYLEAAMVVLGPTLTYERELVTGDSAALEFRADLEGMAVHGIDLIRWGDDGRIVDFTVMVRPMKGLQALVERMAAQLR
ncbi:MAG: nuclear transport factor 2 family protein [Lapillicoccus sp.]